MSGFKLKTKEDKKKVQFKQVEDLSGITTQDINNLFTDEPFETVECGTQDELGQTSDPEIRQEDLQPPSSPEDPQTDPPPKKRKEDCSTQHSSSEEEEVINRLRQQQANFLRKKNSPSNSKKGKHLRSKTPTSASTSTNTMQPSTSPTTNTKTFIQIVMVYLLGETTKIWTDIQELWEVQLMSTLEEEGVSQEFLDIVMTMMSKFIQMLKECVPEKSLLLFLSDNRDSLLRKPMTPEVQSYMTDFWRRFKTAKRDYQSHLATEANNSTVSPSTTCQTSSTTTVSTSVAGTDPPAGAAVLSPGTHSLSSVVAPTPSRGWTLKASSSSSFITWVDHEYQFSVKSLENSGDIIVKTEIYDKSQVAGLPPQEWWKYPLHRSKVEISRNTRQATLLQSWTNELENMWVDRRTGEHLQPGIVSEMMQRRLPPARKEPSAFNPNSGPVF